jgi:hypothetical protein
MAWDVSAGGGGGKPGICPSVDIWKKIKIGKKKETTKYWAHDSVVG